MEERKRESPCVKDNKEGVVSSCETQVASGYSGYGRRRAS